MPPTLPRPDELPIPAPWWVFQALLLLTFLLHVLAMNVLVGGTFLAALGLSRRKPGDDWLARRLLGVLPTAFAATVTLGVAPLLFAQVLYGHFLYTSAILMAGPWLAVVGLALAAYALAYRLSSQAKTARGPAAGLVWLELALLCAIAFVFVNVMTLAVDPTRWRAMYFDGPGGGNFNLADVQVVPRVLHMLVGAVAVGALFAAFSARSAAPQDSESARDGTRAALRVFRGATLIQLPIGIAFLLTQPQGVLRALMGRSPTGTIALVIGVVLAVVVVVDSSRAIRSETPGASVPRLSAVTLALVASMVILRDVVRRAALAPHFAPDDLAASPQWGVFAVFVVTFAVGLGVLAWLVRVWTSASREPARA